MSHTNTVGSEIKVSNLGMSFADKNSARKIFHDIDVVVSSGDFVSICGLSGVGKSTFLRVLAGLIAPTEGTVMIDGQIIITPPKTMSFVTQDYSRSLFPWLSVSKNVALPFRAKKIEKSEIDVRVTKALSDVGLGDFSQSFPWQLSGGMQQRVAIARALITRPQLLLLDEPFASVDAHTRLELEDLVLNLTQEIDTTTIMVTHDIDEATYMSDRVFVMTGSPASFTSEFKIELDSPRSQSQTRSHKDFLRIRDELYKSMRR